MEPCNQAIELVTVKMCTNIESIGMGASVQREKKLSKAFLNHRPLMLKGLITYLGV